MRPGPGRMRGAGRAANGPVEAEGNRRAARRHTPGACGRERRCRAAPAFDRHPGTRRRRAPRRAPEAGGQRILGEQLGQAGSIAHGQPADALGRPLPWYTYPAIEYLERLALDGARIFEFGCGNSTRYWCRRGARVTAVEHSREWFDELEASVESAELLYRPDRDSYVSALRESGASFDVIVVDGVWRERCVDEAIARAAPQPSSSSTTRTGTTRPGRGCARPGFSTSASADSAVQQLHLDGIPLLRPVESPAARRPSAGAGWRHPGRQDRPLVATARLALAA
jgi:hypothetical protein